MPEFTLHDPNHSNKIIEIMDKIIPQAVIEKFNSIELSLLILSAYLHDIGMTCDKATKEDIISNSQEFDILFKSNIDKYQKFEQYKSEENHRAATFIEDQIFTEYLRRNHVKRSANFISENLVEGKYELTYNEIPFYKLLIKICNAHGEPVKNLYNDSIFPRETLIGDNIINVQYLSLILRLADILDLDAERTPKVIYEFVNPENPVSILEWKKHRSVIGSSINDRKILFEAECSSPEVERALKEFIDWIELERKETMELLHTYSKDEAKKYFLSLEEPVTQDRIYSDESYIYNDLKFNLDYQRIMSLLMGQKLYKDPTTALRELLQNSIDAIKVRQKIYENKTEQILPFIKIQLSENNLSIEDNGVGMNIDIFKNYFLQIGKSYYSSQNFYSQFNDLDVTSEFGIGILSAFMIANSIIIDSRREPDDPLSPHMPIHFEIPAAQSYLIQRKGDKRDVGTRILLNLKENNPFKNALQLIDIIKAIIPNPLFPIVIIHEKEEYLYEKKSVPEITKLKHTSNFEDFLRQNQVYESEWINSFTHSVFSIDFEKDSDYQLRDIQGKLLIVNSNPINYYSRFNGQLSQRSFTIGYPETIENKFIINATASIRTLFPKWLSYYSTLNLTKNACLSITPDRTDITIDEKFKILKHKIETKIITDIENYLRKLKAILDEEGFNKFIDFLYVAGFFGFDLDDSRKSIDVSPLAKTFFLEWLTIPTLDNHGVIVRTQFKKLINSENIAVIKKEVSQNDINSLLKFKSDNNLELVLLDNFEFSSHRYEELFVTLLGSTRLFMQPVKLLLRPLASIPIYLHRYKSQQREDTDYHFFHSISNSDNIDDTGEVFFSTQNFENYPQFNKSSIFIKFLFTDINILFENKKNLQKKLANGIHDVIINSLNIFKKSENNNEVILAHSKYSHIALDGILHKDPNLLDGINKFYQNFINEAKKLGVLAIDEKIHKITSDNLPWFWSNKTND
ncbi:ATP-binding protein [Chryseobacterium sp. 09-1422]|uniref:ATP-binding protein n=1 Tax=Chryseobacterium kimseyorum TaxID=2984028 RepID=A0ABT3HXT9_9FLAO|nr:ATP-binding protein [Chryseobacterium kimseyorum]MCW3168622.1 ATP-binding protein [Chryseobacterium kimseyorum]